MVSSHRLCHVTHTPQAHAIEECEKRAAAVHKALDGKISSESTDSIIIDIGSADVKVENPVCLFCRRVGEFQYLVSNRCT